MSTSGYWQFNNTRTSDNVFLLFIVQVVPLLMKAIGWQGGSILALETLKRVVAAGNRARDALVAQGLKYVFN